MRRTVGTKSVSRVYTPVPHSGPQCIDGFVDIGAGGIEEHVDVLAVPGCCQPGQERPCTLEHPSVGVIGAE
jgi:hypothetical protein